MDLQIFYFYALIVKSLVKIPPISKQWQLFNHRELRETPASVRWRCSHTCLRPCAVAGRLKKLDPSPPHTANCIGRVRLRIVLAKQSDSTQCWTALIFSTFFSTLRCTISRRVWITARSPLFWQYLLGKRIHFHTTFACYSEGSIHKRKNLKKFVAQSLLKRQCQEGK